MAAGIGSIRVYVADDHPIYRDGLIRAFQRRRDFNVVGEAADGDKALQDIRELRPDVALLDLRMPGPGGLELLKTIKLEDLPTRVVLVSAFSDNEIVYQSMASGAAAYVLKEADRDQICDAIAAVARGETWLPPLIQSRLLAAIQARANSGRPSLTGREQQVLKLTADGFGAPEIGRRLSVSAATVKTHLQHVYEKLDVSDRAAAVAEGMRRGLLS
jgi:two-component system nitrate/nitrite response regulator NarL